MTNCFFFVFVSAANIMLSDIQELPALKFGDMDLKLELDDLSPEMREIARKELRETPEVSKSAMEELKILLKEDKELTVPYDNEQWLVRFLRPCKFYPESAYDLVSVVRLIRGRGGEGGTENETNKQTNEKFF